MILLACVLVLHWVADAVCQSHAVAVRKAHDAGALVLHVVIYTLVMTIGVGLVVVIEHATMEPARLVAFSAITFVTHLATDCVTAPINAKLFGERWHDFFVMVFFDQLVHQLTLVATISLLGLT